MPISSRIRRIIGAGRFGYPEKLHDILNSSNEAKNIHTFHIDAEHK